MRLRIFVLSFIVFSIVLVSAVSAETRIKCASTTSTQNSGLLEHLLPRFEERTGIKIDVVAVGTGAAIEIGKRGDVDLILVHAKEQELAAVEQGYFVNRHDVMYNDFVVIGPLDDPTSVKGLTSASEAFLKIAEQSASFVSRGDKSGTHARELALWKQAGLDPKGRKWYLEVGQGMAKTQRIAGEKRAYTLTDRGTWLAAGDRERLDLIVVLEGDPALFNQYGVMAVNPAKHAHVKHKESMAFINWLISKDGQDAIGSFRDRSGNVLFTPNVK